MLQEIRDRTHGWIAGIIISILILSFALWGIHYYLTSTGDNQVVATVNGAEINRSQLALETERLQRQIELNSGGKATFSSAELKSRALVMLLNNVALKQAAYAMHYRISSQQVESFLQAMPQFQENGFFSPSRFGNALATMLYTPDAFIDLIKTSLIFNQQRTGIFSSAFVLSDEVVRAISLLKQKRNIDWFVIPGNYFSDKNNKQNTINNIVSESDIQAFYDAHKNDFFQPEKVKVDYIELIAQPKKDANHSKTENKDIADPKFSELREKLASLVYEHPESLVSAAKSLGLSIKSTDFFEKNIGNKNDISSIASVRDAAFSDDVKTQGNNSDVIEVDANRVIVLRVKEHTPETILPITSVRKKIVAMIEAQRNQEKLAKFVESIVQQLRQGKMSLADVASNYRLVVKETGFIEREDPSKKIDEAVLQKAFQLPKPSSVASVKLNNGYAIVILKAMSSAEKLDSSSAAYQQAAKNLQESIAELEYDSYQTSLIANAKINVTHS